MSAGLYQIVLTVCPNEVTAESIADTLVREGLAACVNRLPPMQSVYKWKGKIERTHELMLLIKSCVADYAAIQARIQDLHPYELPEIIAVPIADGLPGYLAWLQHPE